MAQFDKGALVRVTTTFTSPTTGAVVDPTTVTFKYRNGTGSITSWTVTAGQIVKASTGVYHADIDTTGEGTWHWAFYGTGTNQGAKEGSFDVVTPGSF